MRTMLILLLPILLTSCGALKTQVQTIYVRDTAYISKVQVDSVYKRDSVFIREKNDTVYKYVERVLDKYRLLHDTIYRCRVDSVYIDNVREVKVERTLTAWQRFRQGAFWWLVTAICGVLLWGNRKRLLMLFLK